MNLTVELSPDAQIALDNLSVNQYWSIDDLISAAIINYQEYLEIVASEY